MAVRGRLNRRRGVAAGSALLLALAAGALAAPASAAPAPQVAGSACPTAYPLSSVTAGLVGQGLTVVRGTTPQPFAVEVLGVMKNGAGANHDLILVNVSDLDGQHVIDQGGGIWEGMSGSPVYVDGQLLGAVSYGFTAAPSTIGALTPAADMYDLLDLAGQRAARVKAPVKTVSLSAATRRSLATKAGVAAPRGTMSQIRTPLGVTGLSSKRVDRLQSDLDRAGRSVRVYAAGASSSVVGAPAATPQAGGNFAAAISTGDLASGYIGTTTAVCGNRAVAFGHPIDKLGPVSYDATDADALAIIKDTSNGSYKMADFGGSFGTVDQDRTAGVRADLTRTAPSATITTSITDSDTGAHRAGTTKVSDQLSLPGLLPYAIFTAQDSVFDEWGDGTATSDWTITGTRAGGKPFSVRRVNRWASRGDVTVDPAVEVAVAANQLVNNDYEKVTISSVAFGSSMATTYQQQHISGLQVKVGKGKWTSAKRLSLKVGDKLQVRVSLTPYRGTKATTTTLALTVPKKARGRTGSLSAVGGVELASAIQGADEDCALFGDCESDESGSLSKVITSISSAPHNNSVTAELSLDDEDGDSVSAATATKAQTLTVTGERDVAISVRR